jgi:hypothetical protein
MGKDRYGQSGGWSATGTMRNDGQSKAAHLQVNFLEREERPNPSKNYTVQFSVGPTFIHSTKAMSPKPVNPIAEIVWSVEGNSVRRLVSVTNGMSVTGVGEAVKVSVSDATLESFAGQSVDYQVDITVAPGTRASIQQPPTYYPQTREHSGIYSVSGVGPIAAPGNTVDVPVPDNAGVISYFLEWLAYDSVSQAIIATTQADWYIEELAAGGLTLKKYSPLNTNGWVPISPGASILRIHGLFPTIGALVSWQLDVNTTFGIDG